MRRRVWVGRALAAVLVAACVNAVLSGLEVRHDVTLVALLSCATVAAGVLALQALDTVARVPWRALRHDVVPDRGEDVQTAAYRHVVEAHLHAREPDDAVVWQIADLARRRVRQLHGFRPEDDPARTRELLGPQLADWVSHDRRHRYVPDAPRHRYSVAALGEALSRIEQLGAPR